MNFVQFEAAEALYEPDSHGDDDDDEIFFLDLCLDECVCVQE